MLNVAATVRSRRGMILAGLFCWGVWWANAQQPAASQQAASQQKVGSAEAAAGHVAEQAAAEQAAAEQVREAEFSRAKAKLKPPAEATVTEFGATGDGTTDDSAAIQQAIDAKRGGVRFPQGNYRITKTITIDLDATGFTSLLADGTARIIMAGAGPAFLFIGTHEGSAYPHTMKPNVWSRQRMPLISGLEIVGEHAEADGIEASGVVQLTIDRLLVRQVRHAIHLTRRNRNIIVSNCHLYENHGIGIYYDNVNLHQSNIVGCHISYNGGGGVVSRGGNVRNIHIGTCDLEANHAEQGPPTANILIDAANTEYGTGEVAITGCTIQHAHNAPDSANIRIIGKTKFRGTPTREGNITITGNVMSDVQTNIHLAHCRGVTLTGNTVWQGYTIDLLAESCSGLVLGANAFDHNPRYDNENSVPPRGGLIFRDCRDCTLTGLQIQGTSGHPAGVLIENSDRFNVSGCSIFEYDTAGLWLKNSRRCVVSHCLIRDDRPVAENMKQPVSLRMTGGAENTLQNNVGNGGDAIMPSWQWQWRSGLFVTGVAN